MESESIPAEEINKDKLRVPDVIKDYQVYFVHGIHANFSPGDNTLLNPKIPWERKLEIVLSIQPMLSASSIKSGDHWRHLWSRMGVILADGEINAAYSTDAGSVSLGLERRDFSFSKGSESSIGEAVKRSGPKLRTGSQQYNEYAISKPEAAGFYVCLDDTAGHDRRDMVSNEKILEEISKYQIPLFVMLYGVVYELTNGEVNAKVLDEIGRNIKDLRHKQTIENMTKNGWRKVEPDEMIDKKIHLPGETRDTMVRETLESGAFNLSRLSESRPYINNLISVGQGRANYLTLADKNRFKHQGADSVLEEKPKSPAGKNLPHDAKEPERLIASFYSGHIKNNFFIREGELIQEKTHEVSGDRSVRVLNGRERSIYIHIAMNTFEMPRILDNTDTYLKGMEESLLRINGDKQKHEEAGETEKAKWSKQVLNRLLYHLYGFGLQAGLLGDEATRQRTVLMINMISNYDEVEKTVKERTNQEGKIKLTLEDLE